MRTVTYDDLKGRFTSAIGVDTLLTAEETAFKRSLNDRVRGAWFRAKWPELLAVKDKTVAAVADLADKAVRIDNDSEIEDVYSVWSKNPFTDATARRLEFSLINGYLVLNADASDTTIYVVGSQIPADDYGDARAAADPVLDEDPEPDRHVDARARRVRRRRVHALQNGCSLWIHQRIQT